ncbi:MAG: NAD-dependent epimerase/dehydratase family protein [Cyanobacteria bacterium P01_E01_bin.6]
MPDTSKPVLITGGLGFIGGHLASRLLQQGHQVTLFDRRIHGEQPWHDKLLNHPNCQCVVSDLADIDCLSHALVDKAIVFHLAANANSRQSLCDRNIDLHHGIQATWNLLNAMTEQGVKQIVYASSQLVYGEPIIPTLTESMGPLLPLSLYGASKLAGEGIISAHSHLHNIHSTILRFGNIVGPHMSYGIVLDFVTKLQQNPLTLEILGDGKQQRNYLHVDDCVKAILTASARDTEPLCDVFNVGNHDCISALDVADIVVSELSALSALNSKSAQYQFTGGKRGWQGDVPNLRCDLSKIHALGWTAQRNSSEAVADAARQTCISQVKTMSTLTSVS